YRLNAFGYLTLNELWDEDKSYGNFGFMDQILALKWIKENIEQFGGNPNLVTVSGQSSGGTSIYGLVASPLARGLFQRGIPMSGSPNFPRNYSIAANDNQMFIKKSKCHTLSSKKKIGNCLYKLSSKEVINIIPIHSIWNFDDLLDFPTFNRIDGSIIVIDPLTIPVTPQNAYLIKNTTSQVDLLIGSTAQEPSITPLHHFKSNSSLKAYIDKKLKEFGPVTSEDVFHIYENTSTYIKGTIDTQYLYETMVTDVRCTCPTNELVKDFRKSSHLSDTYRYVSAWKPKTPIKFPPLTIVNAAHALDSFALFGFKMFPNVTATATGKQFTTTIRKVFKKFMVEGKVDGTKPGGTIVFNGDGNAENIVGDYHKEQCEMWNKPSNGFLPYAWIN
ncbi:MAG: carboxylesterase family protein, partial [Cyanobacteria bacterium J06649_11]